MTLLYNVLGLLFGFALLIGGADFLVRGAVAVAEKFHVPHIVIGLTIVALGTSMPELVICVFSALSGSTDLVLGNVVGSNICNILLILGLSGLVAKQLLPIGHIRFDLLVSLFGIVLLVVFTATGQISRPAGIVFLAVYALYMVKLVRQTKQHAIAHKKETTGLDSDAPPIGALSMGKASIFMGLGLIGLFVGGKLSVWGASSLAVGLGMSEKLVGLTVVAVGTSLPELVTCVAAVRKGRADLAIGNVIGSNILNIYFILGATCLVSPIRYDFTFGFDFLVLCVATLLLFLFMVVGGKNKLNKPEAAVFLLGYVGYLGYSILQTGATV